MSNPWTIQSGKICVLGSLNVDLTVTLERFHQPGETITGKDFHTFTGGKGGNQAVAAAKLGMDTLMIGCVGADDNGRMYKRVLGDLKVDTQAVEETDEAPTGVALIEVDEKGENRIAVVPGANALLTCDLVSRHQDKLMACDVCLMQLESPVESVNHAAALLRRAGKKVILDPAPARPLSDALLFLCDIVTPNETELEILTGMSGQTEEQAIEAAASLLKRGVGDVVLKRGAKGAIWVSRQGARVIPGFKVDVVDTTAAGDSFNAGLAAGLVMGYPMEDAVRLANAVGALSTTAAGAQAAMPSMERALELVEGA